MSSKKFLYQRLWKKAQLGFEKLRQTIGQDFGEIERRSRSSLESLVLKTAKIGQLTVMGFMRDNCPLRASALTFMTLVALVPTLAFAFSIAKGFEIQEKIKPLILNNVPETLHRVINEILTYVENTNTVTLGTLGFVVVAFTAIRTISRVEATLNAIWAVSHSRSLLRRTSDYLSVMLVAPILIFAATSMWSHQLVAYALDIGPLKRVFEIGMPLVVAWACFTFVYKFLPNTVVKLRMALIGGVFAGTLWHLAQWWYIRFQVDLTKYNVIYGGFASFPIFLMWLYLAWAILLFGAEMSFAAQNAGSFIPSWAQRENAPIEEERAALGIMYAICERYCAGQGGISIESISEGQRLAARLSGRIISYLENAGLVAQTGHEEALYLPAVPPNQISVKQVLDIVRSHGKEIDFSQLPANTFLDSVERKREEVLKTHFGDTTFGGFLKSIGKNSC